MNSTNLTAATPLPPKISPIIATEGFIDKAEVARRLGKTTRTVEIWSNRGFLPSFRVGRSRLYSWADIEAHIRDNFSANPRSR